LPTNDLRALVIDPSGNFWLAVGRGLVRTSRRDLEAVLAGRQRLLRRTSYGRSDGLPKVGFTFGRRNASLGTPDGRIWFATDRGALTVSPEPLPESVPLAPVLLEEVLVDQQPIPVPRGVPLVLPSRPGPLEIRYTVPHLTAPERLRFRYRLVGLEENWTSTQTERTATYVRLPAGHYRFEVAVSEGEDALSPSSLAVLAITVRAAWWETALFRGGAGIIAVVAVASLVWMIVLRRVRARIRRLEQEHALERERSRIARDMHDDLGASLTRIALMSEIAADEPEMRGPAARQLSDIAQAARAVSSTLDQIVWTVNPRNDTLERLVGYIAEFAGEYLAPTGLNLHFDLPVEMPEQIVPAESRHEMLLATKEALNNIVKYAQAKSVTLRVTTQGRTLEVLITDDGCGFDAEAVSAFSNGLLNLRQRLAAVGGSADIATQPGAGTTVTLRLPLPG
jgi:signal transduction histidine kinase